MNYKFIEFSSTFSQNFDIDNFNNAHEISNEPIIKCKI